MSVVDESTPIWTKVVATYGNLETGEQFDVRGWYVAIDNEDPGLVLMKLYEGDVSLLMDVWEVVPIVLRVFQSMIRVQVWDEDEHWQTIAI